MDIEKGSSMPVLQWGDYQNGRAVLWVVSACRAQAASGLLEGGGRRRKAGFGVDCVLSVRASDCEKG